MTGPRIGVIGARRRRQGVGEHLARFAHEAGARVVAVAGTSRATVEEARAGLARWGIDAKGHADAGEMLAAEALDALVIASPAPLHERHLRLGLDAGLHVLCEKPFVWAPSPFSATARDLVDAFAARGLHLRTHTQWPETLPAYRSLFPDVAVEDASAFEMRLSPGSSGYEMLVDAVPHAVSVLASAVGSSASGSPAPGSQTEGLRAVSVEGERSRIEVRFDFPGARRAVRCRVVLETCPAQPRPAAYGFDGRLARRAVSGPAYRMSLVTEDGAREVPLEDPARACVAAFVAAVARDEPAPRASAVALESRWLEDVLAAWEGPIGVVGGLGGG